MTAGDAHGLYQLAELELRHLKRAIHGGFGERAGPGIYSASERRLLLPAACHLRGQGPEGGKPADLPVEQPTKFELMIKLQVTAPHSLLPAPMEVIE